MTVVLIQILLLTFPLKTKQIKKKQISWLNCFHHKHEYVLTYDFTRITTAMTFLLLYIMIDMLIHDT